jgi:NAD(P)H-dependent FMN reductase
MSIPTIGIIISTTREGRFGDRPANWILELARQRTDLAFELVDLRDYPVPMFDAPLSPNYAPVDNDASRAFVEKMRELDGFLVVTAEYNHSISGVLKNALDHVPFEAWAKKPMAFVGYGGTGGARTVEQLRLIAIEMSLVPTRAAVHIGMEPYLGVWKEGKSFNDFPYLVSTAGPMLDELAWYAKALKAGREMTSAEASLAA